MPWRRCFFSAIATLVLMAAAQASTERAIHNFNPTPHGTFAPSSLVADASRNLYGTAGGGSHNAGVLYKTAQNSQGKWTQTVLYTFTGGTDGFAPGHLVIDSAGNLYGFSTLGGTGSCYAGCGVALKFAANAHGVWSATILFNFPKTDDDSIPTGLIAMDKSGHLYGVTSSGGDQASESVFELTRSSGGNWTETVLQGFTGGSAGAYIGGLAVDPLGNLYGTTEMGGLGAACQCGTVFELSPSSGTWTYSILYSFLGGTTDGSEPFSVTLDSSGNLFGTTILGGSGTACRDAGGCGTVYELQPGSNGQWRESTLYSFGHSDLYVTPSVLVIDSAHNMYGTTYYGGTGSRCYEACGTVFELSPNGDGQWSETTLYNFQGGADGYSPSLGLALVGNILYGTTSLGGTTAISGTIFSVTPQQGKWQLRTLYSFPFTDGNGPYTGLIADSSGNLYGTSNLGGTYNTGSVFEMSPKTGGAWSERIIYSFTGATSGYSVGPSTLISDSLGNFYGTTAAGGTNQRGTIFELSPSSSGVWVGTTLYTFSGGGDGWSPSQTAGLILDQSGNLYGTTHNGGVNGKGTIFELSPESSGQWKKSVLYNFAGSPLDGQLPSGGLILDNAGNLYGTTETGGSSTNCPSGCGTVFELSRSGVSWKETLLYSFQGGTSDGSGPTASVVFDAAGNLYGTTFQGGINAHCYSNGGSPGCGVVFQLSASGNGNWKETVLHNFANSAADGGNPTAGLVLDAGGDLFGTTGLGGTYGHGTIFKLTPSGSSWAYSVAYNFANTPDGQYPAGNLLPSSSGTFYGTTLAGGNAVNLYSSGYGTVFEFTP